MPWTTPRTWVTSELVTATIMNTHVKDNLTDLAFTGHIVKARNRDATVNAIAAPSPNAEQTVTLSIPASWNEYDIEAFWTGQIAETGTMTADRTVTIELRITNESGTLLGTNRALLAMAVPDNNIMAAVNGFLTAQTTTGSVIIAFCAGLAGDSGQASWDEGTLIAHAYRTA